MSGWRDISYPPFPIFPGNYIQVKGAKDNNKITRPANYTEDPLDLLPTWTCQLDDTPVRIKTHEYAKGSRDTTDIRLCEQGDLTPTRHTVRVNVNVTDPNTQAFWLDSIEYASLDSTNLPANEVVRVDSSDPSCTYHDGTWEDRDYANVTKQNGATVSFKFNGTYSLPLSLSFGNLSLSRNLRVTLWNFMAGKSARAGSSGRWTRLLSTRSTMGKSSLSQFQLQNPSRPLIRLGMI